MKITLHRHQAVTTRYLPTTTHKPARIKATAEAASVIVPSSYGEEGAVRELLQRLGWDDNRSTWHGARIPKTNTYVFVCDET